MSRKKARDFAFKLVFEIPFYENEYKSRLAAAEFDETLTDNDREYIQTVVDKCFSNQDSVDGAIESSLRSWTIKRLPKVTAAILRLAVSEMRYIDDVPYQVAINEAVELAKTYGGEEAASFVNGVLANLIKEKE